MTTDDKIICDALDNILQFLYDSKVCVSKHMEILDDQQLKTSLKTLTNSREKMINEITEFLLAYNYQPEIKSILLGKSHSIFENLKQALLTKDILLINREVKRSEGVLIEYYKNALALDLPNTLRKRLILHLNKIENDMKESNLQSVSSS